MCVIAAVCAALPQAALSGEEFEVASIKRNTSGADPGSVRRSGGLVLLDNVSLRECIQLAYGIGVDKDYALSGPAWINSEKFDIVAKTAPEKSREEVLLMLRELLKDRFKLVMHQEKKERRVYSLVAAARGPMLKEAAPGQDSNFTFRPGHIDARALRMTELANRLSGPLFGLGVPVIDSTALSGTFDFMLDWAPDVDLPQSKAGDAPSLFTALQEQLGLKLVSTRTEVELWVIDRLEKTPSEN
jgi:uncharacterized protein (TIGR03435 family)